MERAYAISSLDLVSIGYLTIPLKLPQHHKLQGFTGCTQRKEPQGGGDQTWWQIRAESARHVRVSRSEWALSQFQSTSSRTGLVSFPHPHSLSLAHTRACCAFPIRYLPKLAPVDQPLFWRWDDVPTNPTFSNLLLFSDKLPDPSPSQTMRLFSWRYTTNRFVGVPGGRNPSSVGNACPTHSTCQVGRAVRMWLITPSWPWDQTKTLSEVNASWILASILPAVEDEEALPPLLTFISHLHSSPWPRTLWTYGSLRMTMCNFGGGGFNPETSKSKDMCDSSRMWTCKHQCLTKVVTRK